MLIYNKKLLADAGITEVPKTTAELDDAITKLEAKGITPFANAYKEWWVWKHIFQHFVNAAAEDANIRLKSWLANLSPARRPLKITRCLYNNFFNFIDILLSTGRTSRLNATAMQKSVTSLLAKPLS